MAIGDYLAPSLEVGSTILGVGSQIAKGDAAVTVGARRKQAADFEAQQLEQSAEESRGSAMRIAQNEQLRTKYANSLAIARAAASGAGASDPTVMAILSRTAGEGAYRASLAMYEGEAQARLDRIRAGALRYEGAVDVADAGTAQTATNMGAVSTALNGGVKVLSMMQRFWSGPDKSGSDPDTSMRVMDAGTQLPEGVV